MINTNLLKNLCMCNGISGDESSVRSLIIDQIKDYTDEITVDNLGNLLVHKKGKRRAAYRLMLSAHMDEVGLLVTGITDDGYIKFDEVGGIDRRVLPGKGVVIGKGNINGVIGIKPVHLSKGDELTSIPKLSEMYIDIGAKDKSQAEKYISVGDSIAFVSDFCETVNTVRCKALDDRFGCLILIEMIKSELEYDMEFAFVVQEEVGLRGAKTAAYSINPEFSIVVETTTAADVQGVDESSSVCKLGEGAVISVMDRCTIYDKGLVSAAFSTAERLSVKAQHKRAVAGGNDAGAIHSSREGVRTVALSLPCRYLHAPNCVVNKNDCEAMLRLVPELANIIAGGMCE